MGGKGESAWQVQANWEHAGNNQVARRRALSARNAITMRRGLLHTIQTGILCVDVWA